MRPQRHIPEALTCRIAVLFRFHKRNFSETRRPCPGGQPGAGIQFRSFGHKISKEYRVIFLLRRLADSPTSMGNPIPGRRASEKPKLHDERGTATAPVQQSAFGKKKPKPKRLGGLRPSNLIDTTGCFPPRNLAKVKRNRPGRSSGSRIVLLTTPSHCLNSGFSRFSSPITAAGPLPILTGFPSGPLTGRQVEVSFLYQMERIVKQGIGGKCGSGQMFFVAPLFRRSRAVNGNKTGRWGDG